MTVRCPPRNLQKGLTKGCRQIGHSLSATPYWWVTHLLSLWNNCGVFGALWRRSSRDFNNLPIGPAVPWLLETLTAWEWENDYIMYIGCDFCIMEGTMTSRFSFNIEVEYMGRRIACFEILNNSIFIFNCFEIIIFVRQNVWHFDLRFVVIIWMLVCFLLVVRIFVQERHYY